MEKENNREKTTTGRRLESALSRDRDKLTAMNENTISIGIHHYP
jgi:hypothetical protein